MYKLYVLIRSDLNKVYSLVQAGHGVAGWLLSNPDSCWMNNTLIYVNVKDEDDLIKWSYKLSDYKLNYVEFREPDINNELTVIACLTNTKIFKNLKLV